MKRWLGIFLAFLMVLSTWLNSAPAFAAAKSSAQSQSLFSVVTLGDEEQTAKLTAAITLAQGSKGQATFTDVDTLIKGAKATPGTANVSKSQVEYTSNKRRYQHTYYPSNIDYIKGSIFGTDQIDGAILVVSAADGPMPVHVGQVQLANKTHIPSIVVFLDTDNREGEELEELVELVNMEIRELLEKYGYPGDQTPIIQGSLSKVLAKDPSEMASIFQLVEAMDSFMPEPELAINKPFFMPIEDVFSIKQRGTVVNGRIAQGTIKVGEEVEIIGFTDTKKSVVTGLEMFRKVLESGTAGDSVGVLLRGVKREEVEQGQVLAQPGSITAHTKFAAAVYIRTKEEGGRHTPFFTNYRPQFYFNGIDVTGTCNLPEGVEMVMPGENIQITVELTVPVAMTEQMRFAINEGGKTVGFGTVTKILQ